MKLTCSPSVLDVWTDERRERNAAQVVERLRHLGNAPDFLVPVRLRELQILVQPEPDVVAAQPVRVEDPLQKRLFNCTRNSGRSTGRQPGKPDGHARLFSELLTLLVSEVVMPCGVDHFGFVVDVSAAANLSYMFQYNRM